MQADIDDLAARLALVPEVRLEQNAQGLVGLQRQAQVSEAADELDRFADDGIRHPVPDAGAIDAVRDREVRPDALVPERIVEQRRGDDRLGGLLITAVVLGRDCDDVLAVLEDCDLLDPVRARQVERAHGHRHTLGRQRLDVGWRILGGAFDHARAIRIEAVGDQEIADRVGHQGLQDGFLELGPPARSAQIDLELVAVRGRQKLALSVSRSFGAAVIVGAVIRLVLGGGDLRRVHRQLCGERLGLLPRLLKFPHVAAGRRHEGRIDEERLRRRLRRLLPQSRRDGDEGVFRRQNRAPAHEHRVARQIDDGRKPDRSLWTRDRAGDGRSGGCGSARPRRRQVATR